ncbi:hypothetical protein [Paenarthrobacter histidinolovorans]|uniref:hypothetical protein n=1 Tax=Paenarthrobacter histidinolovorans TaxID=43664 RepID=UPI0019870760|nr:hypothetical protein [Paenarthrobacter histidinolovorans]GGJ12449.1 hypothetical protein GCM10010052_07330 [Paenarthrobacter histidinolovorans]
MRNDYHLPDGSPRYGNRTETIGERYPTSTVKIRVEEAAQGAARLSLDDMAAAIDRRLESAWADVTDPSVAELRQDNPEELAEARAIVSEHLGTQRQWRLKAQGIRDKRLAATIGRRRASGGARKILLLRAGLIIALIAPPAYIVATNQNDLVKLVVTGAICLAAAFAGGHYLTILARVPVMPTIRSRWLAEIREDIVNATLVAILLDKDAQVHDKTVAAARRGWESVQVAAKAAAGITHET